MQQRYQRPLSGSLEWALQPLGQFLFVAISFNVGRTREELCEISMFPYRTPWRGRYPLNHDGVRTWPISVNNMTINAQREKDQIELHG